MEARDFVVQLRAWGLTQAQIAERSGIPQPTISKIFRGEVKDVLSQNYRNLQAVHAEEASKQPIPPTGPPPGTDPGQHAIASRDCDKPSERAHACVKPRQLPINFNERRSRRGGE
jgi:transcriptional regulator with XRE-family HTH domain